MLMAKERKQRELVAARKAEMAVLYERERVAKVHKLHRSKLQGEYTKDFIKNRMRFRVHILAY